MIINIDIKHKQKNINKKTNKDKDKDKILSNILSDTSKGIYNKNDKYS